ncbi:MAG: S8 family serine peptidase [Rhodobacterales bacterium]|nr:S8 family serine peptidase [Rhodobacterales bacterium]
MVTLLLSFAWGAQPLTFHPGPGTQTVEVRLDGTLVGATGRVRQAVVVKGLDYAAIRNLDEVTRVVVGPTGRLARVFPASGVDSMTLSSLLHGREDVLWAHPDVEVQLRPQVVPNDPWLGDQWHLINTGQYGYTPGADINAREAWTVTHGAGMMVAVVDSGLDQTHPDLRVTPGYDLVDDDDDSYPSDGSAHGTAVGGLAAGTGNNGVGTSGVAYEGALYGIRLIGGYTSMYDVYLAFVEATDAGAVVINNSWGFDDGCSDVPLYGELEEAVDYAEEQGRDGYGTAVVFSAGNSNCDVSNDGLLGHPAVIGVAATDGYDRKESYSSWGPFVDIAAPGSRIATTDIAGGAGYQNGDYTDDFSGTSAAAPVISGVLALIFAANERITAAEAREVLCDTADRVDQGSGNYDADGWSPYYGCGRVNAGAAVKAIYNAGPPGLSMPLGPLPEVVAGPVTLEWSKAVDPDNDALNYRIRWWSTYSPAQYNREDAEGTSFTFPEDLQVGDSIAWKVRAEDLWGLGEWSEESQFVVIAKPVEGYDTLEASGGCRVVSGGGSWGWILLLAPLVTRRKRG